jgi:hypothetical protein
MKSIVKFYTDSGRYMGWKYLHNINRLELQSWKTSGNSYNIIRFKKGAKS